MKKNIAKEVEELIKSTVEGAGFVLWNVELVKEPEGLNLLVTIDREEGVSLDDCSVVTKLIDPMLDEADPIEGAYFLEVSSVGLDRVLKRKEHYDYAAEKGLTCKFKLFAAVEGAKELCGVITEAGNESVTVESEGDSGKVYVLPKKSIAKAYVVYDI